MTARGASTDGPGAGTGVVAVVAWRAGSSNVRLVEGWRRLGIPAELVDPRRARRVLGPGDVAVVRLDVTRDLAGIEAGLADVGRLAEAGVRLINRPAAVLAAHDKWRTARCLERAGVRTPRTAHRTSPGEIRRQERPFVLKPRFGSWGEDIMLCRTAEDVERCLATLARRPWFRRNGVLVQELVPSGGRDLRVVVAGDRVIGAITRRAAPGEWRTNEALGARASKARPGGEARALGLAAAHAVGTDLAAVDLLPLPGGGHVVLEINAALDFDQFEALPGHDVYRDAASALGLLPTAARAAAEP